jgi:hypothetical protein
MVVVTVLVIVHFSCVLCFSFSVCFLASADMVVVVVSASQFVYVVELVSGPDLLR